jgi:hypothetical protein
MILEILEFRIIKYYNYQYNTKVHNLVYHFTNEISHLKKCIQIVCQHQSITCHEQYQEHLISECLNSMKSKLQIYIDLFV